MNFPFRYNDYIIASTLEISPGPPQSSRFGKRGGKFRLLTKPPSKIQKKKISLIPRQLKKGNGYSFIARWPQWSKITDA